MVSSAKNTETKQLNIKAPSLSKILKFAIPATGVWLCGPLLSLIDTSAVGIFSGTAEQAALNPAVAVTDYSALLIAFMYTGTTNMVATAQESDQDASDKYHTTRTMVGAMQMSTYVGAILGGFLFIFAGPLIKSIIGNNDIDPSVVTSAMKYVMIRAVGMPAAAIVGSTQAACLGMQDVKSPLYVLMAAALVNFFGDILLVPCSNPWLGGAAGAAWATVISQYVAVIFFALWLTAKTEAGAKLDHRDLSSFLFERTRRSDHIDGDFHCKAPSRLESSSWQSEGTKVRENTLTSNEEKESSVGFSVHGLLENQFSITDVMKFPSKKIQQNFGPYIVPVTMTQIGRVSGYLSMSHVVASSLGTNSMAAQQVLLSLFYCLCPIADSLSLTAQSLIPCISEQKQSPEKAAALQKALLGFMKAGALFGIGMMCAVSAIPLLSGLFTSDSAVIALVNSVVPLLHIFFGTHGFVCSCEGMLLGQKDLGFLGSCYGIFVAAVPFLMMRLKREALSGNQDVDLVSVWSIFVIYQSLRCVVWISRSLQLQWRAYQDANMVSSLNMA